MNIAQRKFCKPRFFQLAWSHTFPWPNAISDNRYQAARFGKNVKMMVRIAKQRIDGGEPFKSVPDLVFSSHADRTMQLDRLLADQPPRFAHLNFRRGDVAAAFLRITIQRQCRERRHAARKFDMHQHIHRAVLQGLKTADGDAKLVARLQIFGCQIQRVGHHADGFRRQGRIGFIKHRVKNFSTTAIGAEQRIARRCPS